MWYLPCLRHKAAETEEQLMQRVILQFSKLGALRFVSHLDFQRLWQRLFLIAGIELEHTQGFNPRPRLRFALPLATGFESEGELLEVFLVREHPGLAEAVNSVCPPGLEVLAATPVAQDFPKLTSLVDALEYRVVLPQGQEVALGKVSDWLEAKGESLRLSDYVLTSQVKNGEWRLLIKVENQKTLRPDLIAHHYFPQYDEVEFQITRTGIFTRRRINPLPRGLSILFD
jgi:radical SAM-linked protein